jgi:hypothetical protein
MPDIMEDIERESRLNESPKSNPLFQFTYDNLPARLADAVSKFSNDSSTGGKSGTKVNSLHKYSHIDSIIHISLNG